ncbi:MAG: aminocarboxymuconate-semialdehyde decarboxylase [Chloroflexota bacterium]|nr:aminocarboxymuconate-semialdehyde decarboxylase [Chloroflexota bacterium]
MIIDLHTHIVPEQFPPAGSRASASRWPSMDHFEAGRARVMIAGENFRTVTEQCWSHARRARDMVAEGVDAQVISPMPELLSYWFVPEDGREFSRYVNEDIARLVRSAPTQLYGLGMVPLQDPELAAKELAGLKQMGLHGIELGSNVNGKSLGEPRFWPFFEEVERQGLAVFVHALHPTFTDRYVGPAVDNPVGFPTDTGLTIASMITGQVLERYPGLRLAFSHGGGTFPYFLPRLEHGWSGQWNGEPPEPIAPGGNPLRERLPKSPTEYARLLYYDTLLFDGRAIRYLRDLMGPSQLIVGTDYPFIPRELPVGKTLRTLGFSDEELEAITWRNCLRFLGVESEA